jgi:DUF309 family protein family protein
VSEGARRGIIDEAVELWNRGEHYEAHEKLEDLVDLLEDDDEAGEIALALVHVAASLHKTVHDVGRSAVPAKLEGALATLRGAPSVWMGIDLSSLVRDLEAMKPEIARLSEGLTREVPAHLPLLTRLPATGSKGRSR